MVLDNKVETAVNILKEHGTTLKDISEHVNQTTKMKKSISYNTSSQSQISAAVIHGLLAANPTEIKLIPQLTVYDRRTLFVKLINNFNTVKPIEKNNILYLPAPSSPPQRPIENGSDQEQNAALIVTQLKIPQITEEDAADALVSLLF
jgi:hypothetical protein